MPLKVSRCRLNDKPHNPSRVLTVESATRTKISRKGKSMIRLALLLTCLTLTGCLVSSASNEKTQGKYVPENNFSMIEPGKTTAGWVQATLGDPSSKTPDLSSQSEIWKYNYTQVKESSGAIFLIFGGSNRKEINGTAFIEMKDGIVNKKWRS